MIGIQMDYSNALPVARGAFPAQRITLPRSLVERCTSTQDVLIEIGMTLGWRHEPDRAVTMFVVVSAHWFCDPAARSKQGIERLW